MEGYVKSLTLITVVLGLLVLASASVSPMLNGVEGDQEVLVQIDDVYLHESNFSAEVDVERQYEGLNIALVDMDASDFDQVSERSFIHTIEPNYRIEAHLSDTKTQINADIGWENNATGENVSVAVLDSGIAEHRYLEVEEAVDYTGEGIGDLNGHGTHVAGIIGSRQENYRGVAYQSELHDLKVLDEAGRGRGDRLLRALDYTVRNDIDVAVLSLGTEVDNCNGNDAMSRAVNTASRNGVITVVAAGNIGPESGTVTSPGCAERALTVGSVDKNDNIAQYSSRGPTSDRRMKPDVVAPGSNIGSTGRTGNFVRMSGTSMAAPQVAGQASALLSVGVEPDEVEDRIKESAVDLGLNENTQGNGRVDIAASLDQEVERAAVESRWTRFRSWFVQVIGRF